MKLHHLIIALVVAIAGVSALFFNVMPLINGEASLASPVNLKK